MKVNLNSVVKVKLTEHGRRVLFSRHRLETEWGAQSRELAEFVIASSNEYRCQFWKLMQIFGSSMGSGYEVFEDMNVEVEQADAG